MIVFEALLPHNPLLLQTEGVEDTHDAVVAISALLSQAEPDVGILITEHLSQHNKAFTILSNPAVTGSLKQFGKVTEKKYIIDTTLASELAHSARHAHIPVQQVHAETLDYGSAIAAHLLGLDAPLLVIGTSQGTILEHAACGEFMQEILQRTNKRIAILITGDCSHKHSVDTPVGFSENSEVFDTKFTTLIAERSISALAHLSQSADDADECVSRAAALGFGMIRKFPTDTHVFAYEMLHGVGVLSALIFTA